MKIRIIKKGLPKAQNGSNFPNLQQFALSSINSRINPVINNRVNQFEQFAPKLGPGFENASNTVNQFTSSFAQPAAAGSPSSMNPFAFLQMSANPTAVQNEFTNMLSGKTDYRTAVQEDADRKLQERFPALGPTPREQELQKIGMPLTSSNSNSDVTADPKSFNIGKAARTASAIGDGLQIAGAAVDYFGQNKKAKDFDRQFRRNQFDIEATSPMFRGNFNINTGTFRDDVTRQPNEGMFQMGGEENFTNVDDTMKIRIISRPQNLEFEYGGQSGYGFDLGQRRVQTEMPQSKSDSVRRTIQEVPRNQGNIEAEKGESVLGDLDGDGGLEHMLIGGERHYNGGTPLNVPEGSFVFSDTKKMKIKDPEILKMFGRSYKAGGFTPAELAKPYNINKYKAIIEDPNADEKDKSTAQLMVNNLTAKLSKLAMIQESMKGFPQGIPSVAQQKQGEEEMAMARYGGSLPKFQGATTGSTVGTPAQTTPIIFDQTFSPKELANLDDPEYAKYQALLNKYDTKLTKGAFNISSIAPEDAREFARLSGKFGFRRKDEQGKDIFRVIQSSTPGLTFTDSRGKKSGFFGGYSPKMYERRLVEDNLGADAVKNMSDLDVRKAYFKELGIDTSNMSDEQLSDEKSLYSNKNFFEKEFYPKFSEKFVGSDYRTQMGDDMMIGAEHFDSYRQKPVEIIPGETPDPEPTPDPERDPEPIPNKVTYGEKTPEGDSC